MYHFQSTQQLRKDIDAYLKDRCSHDDAVSLLEYLSTDAEAEKLFKQMSAFRAMSEAHFFARQEKPSLRKIHRRIGKAQGHTVSFWIATVAAAVAALLLVNSLVLLRKNREVTETYTQVTSPYVIRVPEGSRTTVSLPDGTLVTLNSGSSIVYNHDFGIFDRKVELKGEGYFEVAKDLGKPFSVHVDKMTVEVTGTTFNVNAYDDEEYILVSLLEGRVNLSNGRGVTMALYQNEVASFNRRSGQFTKKHAEVKNSTDWVNGGFTFENTPFTTIAHRLERKFNIRIIIESERLKKQYYTATFSAEKSVYDILREIDVENQYTWRETDGGLIISEKTNNH